MQIGVSTFGCDLRSGMSRYVTNLIEKFSLVADEDSFEIVAHKSAVGEYLAGASLSSVKPVCVPESWGNPVLNVAWHQFFLPALCRRRNYDALFLPAASRRMPFWAPCPTIGTVHDFSHFHISGKYDHLRNIYQMRVLPQLLQKLTHIIAISESTKSDIQEYVGVPDERITVVHHAADTDVFYPRDRDTAMGAVLSYGVRPPYILYTSRIEHPAKNHLRLIQAFEMLKKEDAFPHQLVLAGADWHGADAVHKAAKVSPFSDDILLTGYVRGEDLPYLYCGADMMAFPSLFEGFGLPILEAMACGVPVACSDISSMPEIAGDAAVLFDPHEVESIASGMLSILSSEEQRIDLARHGLQRASQFSWEKTARETLNVIHRVVEQ